MQRKLIVFKRFAIVLSIAFATVLFFLSCNENGERVVLKVDHGNLVFEVNQNLETRITTSWEGVKPIMGDFQASEQLKINDNSILNFQYSEHEELLLNGELSGKQWLIKGNYSDGEIAIDKKLIVTSYDKYPDLLTMKVLYTNKSGKELFVNKWINNDYSILSQGDTPAFWAFQGSSSTERDDWIKPLEPGFYQKNYMGMNDSDYGGGIPVTSIWRPDINIAVGHLDLVPKLVNLPTEFPAEGLKASIAVSKEFDDRTVFAQDQVIETLETFVSITKGDYYLNLQRYSGLMQDKGIKMVEREEAAFEPIWCAWGYERDFTLDEIVNTLPKVKELGIKWAVLDDGFQIAEGDWDANPDKFPQGNKEIKKLVDDIHSYGLKAKIWWTPLAADPHSNALKKDADMMITLKNGSPQFITWWNAYYLSPSKEKTIAHTKDIINLFMDDWGFDGLKMDGQHMNAVDLDYSLDNPEKAPESVPGFFQMIYDTSRDIKPHAVVENCPCGTCMSFYNMASMNQAVSSDPLSSWQIRHKGKTYKALIPHTAYYGDHVELSDNGDDFATSFGIGAVLGTKFTWPKDNPKAEGKYLLTPEKEIIWKKWFSLYNEKMLSKEPYLGELYDIGYDKPETHVIEKEGTLYYAFYNTDWDGPITLRGLESNTEYTIKDYFNEVDLGIITGKDPIIKAKFKDYLLIEASPIKNSQ